MIRVHGMMGLIGPKCRKQRTNTLIAFDGLLLINHGIQAVDCGVRPTMFNELLYGKGKIFIGLISICTSFDPILTFLLPKPFRGPVPSLFCKGQTSEELTHLFWCPIGFIHTIAPIPAFASATLPDKPARQGLVPATFRT